ncbi:uncharacterized protein LOC115719382 isoform X1 [Cannabis sativa]|uniref:uncharacterized protein LOC115719382 isoform X1 n=1 Tax=Cannabis sativa TaxID=3483 RepID=UPI0029CA744A|nr:uncharacterized protein LOC115719382 isoform X1 [Cannabis sativa]
MTRLSSDRVLRDNNTRDPSTIEALTLNHRALSDVSCLKDFKILERLDLRLNNLTSLEDLKLCTNLRWLSVTQNKLESLKGIEALTQLTVLNAGKNKLKSMNEVRSITSLRAIILNDNEISSICRLDQMKELNTIVLSKNPIGEIGDSLINVKSLTKLSLSYCQIRNIGASLKSCVELKELRLSHNDIKSLPAELAYNKDIQNLDLGYNAITTWSDVKVLNSFVSLKNLNLQGNPIADHEKSVKKVQVIILFSLFYLCFNVLCLVNLILTKTILLQIKNTFPNLHVFNAKPTNKRTRNDLDSSVAADKDPDTQTEEMRDHVNRKNSKYSVVDQDSPSDFVTKKKVKGGNDGTRDNAAELPSHNDEKRDHVKAKKSKHQNPDLERKSKQESEEQVDKLQKRKVTFIEKDDAKVKKLPKTSKTKRSDLDIIDDSEASFMELVSNVGGEVPDFKREKKFTDKSGGVIVTFPGKTKKAKSQSTGFVLSLSPEVEVGVGGPSTWGD